MAENNQKIVKKKRAKKPENILLTDLVDDGGEPVLNKRMLAKLAKASAAQTVPLVTLKDLADWLVDEEGDVSDVLDIHGNFVFDDEGKDSRFLMAVAWNHPSLEKHQLHEEFVAIGDNPLTEEKESGEIVISKRVLVPGIEIRTVKPKSQS